MPNSPKASPNQRSLADLPYELEREIFELAARAHPNCAPRLALVCRYVQIWVEAVIYETIVLGPKSEKQDLFLRTFSARPPSFFAKSIRELHLSTGVSLHHARNVLAACTNLSSLTCWANPLASREDLLALLSPHLRRLSINALTLWPPTATAPDFSLGLDTAHPHALFARLTHLEIVNPPSWFDWRPLLNEGVLPRLTHIAFGDLDARHAAGDMLAFFHDALASSAPRLEMLIAVSQNEQFLYELERAKIEDERFVCLPSYHYPLGPMDYWDKVARREMHFWGRREEKRLIDASMAEVEL